MENLVDIRRKFAGKRVLVTGHTGFKGSWLVAMLARLGARVAGISLDPETDWAHFTLLDLSLEHDVRADLTDRSTVTTLLHDFRPEYVFHLAAQSLVRRAYRSPVETFATNVMGTAHLLDAIQKLDTPCIVVVATSDKCYENREWIWPYRENDRLGGRDPYAASKAAQEMVAHAWRASWFDTASGVALATVRAGNIIGGGDWAEDRLVPDIVRAVMRDEPVHLRHPDAVRPWQHVLDPVFGYLLLAARLSDRPELAGAWNFGPDDQGVQTVESLTRLFLEALGRGRYDTAATAEFHEAKLLRIDASKARWQLGWGPVLDFAGAVTWTADWYRTLLDGGDAAATTDTQIDTYLERCSQ